MTKQILIITLALLSMQPAYSMEFNKCPAAYNAANSTTLPPAPEQQPQNWQAATVISSYSSEISRGPAVGSSAHSIMTTHYCSQTGKNEDHPVGILCLPSNTLENICQYLRFKDISALRRSCKQFRLVWPHERALQFNTEDLKRFAGAGTDWLAVGIAFLSNKLKDHRNSLELSLSINQFTELLHEMQYLPHLQILDLRNNNLSQDTIKNLCSWLPALLKLDLGNNQLTELPREIQQLSRLQSLELWDNHLSQDAIRNLCSWLPGLLMLNLSFNELTELPHEIRQLSHLQRMGLYNNHLTQDVIKNLCSWLPTLLELNLGFNQLKELPHEIQQLSHLQRLILRGNDLSQDAIRNLCSWLPNLVELDLGLNELTELPQEIKQLSHLQRLDLRNNNLSDENRRTIAQWLPNTEIEF